MAIRERRLLETCGASPGGTLLSRTIAPTIGTKQKLREPSEKTRSPRIAQPKGSDCLAKEAIGTESSALPLEPSAFMCTCRAPNSMSHKLLTKNCGSSFDC